MKEKCIFLETRIAIKVTKKKIETEFIVLILEPTKNCFEAFAFKIFCFFCKIFISYTKQKKETDAMVRSTNLYSPKKSSFSSFKVSQVLGYVPGTFCPSPTNSQCRKADELAQLKNTSHVAYININLVRYPTSCIFYSICFHHVNFPQTNMLLKPILISGIYISICSINLKYSSLFSKHISHSGLGRTKELSSIS